MKEVIIGICIMVFAIIGFVLCIANTFKVIAKIWTPKSTKKSVKCLDAPICKNCKYFTEVPDITNYVVCSRTKRQPTGEQVNDYLVFGKPIVTPPYACETEREDWGDSSCGPTGKHFEKA
jgi:hypothetical protein